MINLVFHALSNFHILINSKKESWKLIKKFQHVKIHKNNFSDPQTINPNKTRWKHFWSSEKKPHYDQNGIHAYIFRFFAIPVLYIIIKLKIFKIFQKKRFNPLFMYVIYAFTLKKIGRCDIYFSIHRLIIYL